MKKQILSFLKNLVVLWVAIGAITFFTVSLNSCAAIDYMKKNCKIETAIGAHSFICVVCNFDNASDELKKKIESKLLKP